jgi:hypothetical protein
MHRLESHNKRVAVRLSSSLEKKLRAYAAVASAAGAGVLACSLPMEAKVVSTVNWIQIVPKGTVTLDLNNDGIPDFQFSNPFTVTSVGRVNFGTLKVLPQSQNNAIWGTGGAASALGSGVTIGSNGKFQPGHNIMGSAGFYSHYYVTYHSGGQWTQVTRGYLGFKFTIQGEIHYGWARLNVAATDSGMYAAVSEYAYETVPNKSIVTGQTGGAEKNKHQRRGRESLSSVPPQSGSLGSLAAGASRSSARQKPQAGRE